MAFIAASAERGFADERARKTPRSERRRSRRRARDARGRTPAAGVPEGTARDDADEP